MNDVPPSVITLGRVGRFAQGLVFVSIGTLSAMAAIRDRGGASDSRGVMHTIVQQPFGRAVLVALIIGLSCYVVWRVVSGLLDAERRGSDAKGLIMRARSLFVAAIYTGITVAAVKTLIGASSRGGGDRAAQDWTATALETPFGSWTVTAVGVGVLIGGCYQIYRGFRGRFADKLDLAALSASAREWVVRICAFGLSARGLVFCVVGIFLMQAGLRSDPSKARGLSGALNSLQAQPYGRWLFAVVAFGLAAFGVYCCVRGRYERIGGSNASVEG